ncbi:hypothetical protein ACOSQ3_027157 [Xanthoceras sorbifolium]
MMQKFNHRIRRSTKRRFEAGCRDINCKFVLRAIRKENCSVWHVRKFNTVHSCSLDAYESHFRSVSVVVIGEIFAPKLNTNGRVIRPVDIISDMREQHGVQLMYTKAWRSKEHAEKILYGKPEDSYSLLTSYFHMLRLTNPGTVTAVQTNENSQFLYSFLALGPCIHGFRSVIRPVIAIDATHLKGAFFGVIYVATSKDGDEMCYPLAFGFGDGESEEGWTCFLRHLREAYGNPTNLVIVSDRHKSIAKTMSSVYPSVPHLVCYYHLKQNLKNHCRGRKDIMELYAKAAYSYQVHSCNASLTQIQNSHPSSFNMLVEAGVDRWARILWLT